jgi:hypothetical protein
LAPPPVPRKTVEVSQAFVARLDLLRAADEIRARTHQPDGGIAVQGPQQPEQPTGRDNNVIIQQQDLAPAGRCDPLVGRGGKPAIGLVDDQPRT